MTDFLPRSSPARTLRTWGVHKVSMSAAASALIALFALNFAVVAPNRVRTGRGVGLFGAVGWQWGLVLVAAWLLLAALSLRSDRSRLVAGSRGVLGVALTLGTLALSRVTGLRLLPSAGEFARLSIGAGAWICVISAYAVVLASRREVGRRTALGFGLAAGLPVGLGLLVSGGFLSDLGMAKEYANLGQAFWTQVVNTIVLSGAALVVASAIGFALGVLAYHKPRYERPVFAVVNAFQTIPGLAMVGLLFGPLSWLRQHVPLAETLGIGGLGWTPVVVALTLYALLAVTRSTYAGLKSVPADVIESGYGMGMTPAQVMRRVRVPLALPVLFSGERTAAVQTVGNSTLGAFVAAFTLGRVIFGGLSQQALDLTMLGSVALVALALVVDGLMRAVQAAVSPRVVRGRVSQGGAGA